MSLHPNPPDTALMKDRIINWLKADNTIFDDAKPEGDPIPGQITTKVTDVIFGVPEEEHWQNKLAPFISVSNADQFLTSNQFFGSVVSDALSGSYKKYQFDIVLVVQASDAETTERLIDNLLLKVINRIESNVQLKDIDTKGNILQGTDICATSRIIKVDSLQAVGLSRRLFAYKMLLECEVNA